MAVYTYSASECNLAFGGITVTNWDTITVTRNTQSFTLVQGIRGKNTRIKGTDTSAVVEIVVPLTSDLNYILTEILRQDELTGNARIALTITDNSNTEVFSANDCFIVGMPARSYTKDIPTRTWTISCMNSELSASTTGWGISSILGGVTQKITNAVSDAVSSIF